MQRTRTNAAPTLGACKPADPISVSRVYQEPRRLVSSGQSFGRVLATLLLFFCLLPATAAPIQYLYDALGRVTGVIDAAGNAATYTYDAAGNIVSAGPTAAVSILQFTPASGPTGTSVTLLGTGFSTTAAQNTVKFNGITATISGTPTANKIVAVVPAAATTGPISITTPTGSATSAAPFTITASQVPTIATFTPDTGTAGTAVTITGTNFDTGPGASKVTFNGRFATVTSATATSLGAVVPVNVSSGKISVATQYGQATSTTDFYVPPVGYAATDIGVTGRYVVDSAASIVSLATAGKVGLFLFDGTQGQYLGLGLSNLSCSVGGNFTVNIYRPDNGQLVSFATIAAGASFNLPQLPATGTYSMVIVPPTGATCNVTLTLSKDIGATLTPNGAVVTFSTARVGQNGRYTFTGTAGKSYSVLWSASTIPSGTLTVYKPDGTLYPAAGFDNGAFGRATGTLDFTNVPMSGTYTVFVDPANANVGAITLALKQDVTGTLAIGGTATTASLAAGQNGTYTFTGAVNQTLGLGVSGLVAGDSVLVTLTGPSGLLNANCKVSSVPGFNCDFPKLVTAGSYTVRVDPQGTNATALTLTLSNDLTGTLVLNGAASTFSTTRIGQNGRYTFSGTIGQNVTLVWTGSTIAGTWSSIGIYKPDGTPLNGGALFGDGANGSGALDLINLPVTGTYTVFIDPFRTSVGAVSLQILSEVIGTLAIDGVTTSVSLTPGRNGRYTFTGTAGQNLGLGVSGLTTTPAGGSVVVSLSGPSGSLSANCKVPTSTGFTCDFVTLPATGTYTVLVDPSGVYAANLILTLSNDITGALTINGASSTFASTRVGQNGRYTFTGTAGQNLTLLWSGSTIAGAVLNVNKPDGTIFRNGVIGIGSGTLSLVNLPVTGAYTIIIDPQSTVTGSVTLNLTNP